MSTFRLNIVFNLGILLALSCLATSFIMPHIGEEGVYTLSSLEMAFSGNLLTPTLFGIDYPRPPFLNWLMLPLLKLFNNNALLAARTLTIISSLVMASTLYWFVNRIFKNKTFATFSVLCLFTGDFLFKRAWLAYSDPLFASLVFLAMAISFVAIEERRNGLILPSLLMLSCAFLTKSLTAYVFYGIMILTLLLTNYSARKFLLQPIIILLHILAFSMPMVWYYNFGGANEGYSMLQDIVTKYQDLSWQNLLRSLFYPIDTFLRFFPISLFAALGVRKLIDKPLVKHQFYLLQIIMLFTFLNYLPYWFSPATKTRYILPLYPWITLLCSYVIWQCSSKYLKTATYILLATLIINCIYNITIMPYYEEKNHGNAKKLAIEVLQATKKYRLYINDSRASGLRLAAEITKLRQNQPLYSPFEPTVNGYLLSEYKNDNWQHYKTLLLGKDTIHLLCKGDACLF